MASTPRRRRHWARRVAPLLPLVALGACLTTNGTAQYPSSTFQHTTDLNTAIDALWDHLLFLGTLVFVLVEAMMVYVIVKYRARPGQAEPRHVHGNTTLEILWTAIPALILVTIAVPTVRTIFRTQAKAVSSALQVQVVGHQWWWEFRYPQYTTRNARGGLDTLTTANELYLPKGRTVNFALRTEDVLHSFWVPRLGGKRDLIANHTNYLWFTPNDSIGLTALNGHCNEYCGASHANMKFRAFVVTPAEFASWVAHQQQPAAVGGAAAPGAPATAQAAQAAQPALQQQAARQGGATNPQVVTRDRPGSQDAKVNEGAAGAVAQAPGAPAGPATTPVAPAAAGDGGYVFPASQLPAYARPTGRTPDDLRVNLALKGDPAKGPQVLLVGGCIACHYIGGNPTAVGRLGPNLTHVGSRATIAGAMYPNDTEHLTKWIKNAVAMKPGSRMPVLGKGQTNPETGEVVTAGLTDQQIADVVAYLQALK